MFRRLPRATARTPRTVARGSLSVLIALLTLVLAACGGSSSSDTGAKATASPAAASATQARGEVSAVPARTAAASPTASAPATYTVKVGDTASLIARGLGVSEKDLEAWLRELAALNDINPDSLSVGQVLKLPGGSTAAASAGSDTTGVAPAPASTSNAPGAAAPTATAGTARGAPTATAPAGASAATTATQTPLAQPATPTPVSTQAPAAAPALILSPGSVTTGQALTMTLEHFPPSSTVSVCLVISGSRDCGDVDVDANGYFSKPGDPLPDGVPAGTYLMEASGANGTQASASFTVY